MRSTGTLVILFVVLVLGFGGCAGCGSYNGLVSSEEGVEQAWGNVETTYQRRADLIPNLVRTVQGAADFESETLEAVTAARSRATSINLSVDDLGDAAKVEEYMAAQSALGGSLGRLIAVAEAYPQLQATTAFRDLQVQLEGTENRINVARRDYNGAVRGYNTRVRQLPGSIIASLTGFQTRTPFEAQAGAETAPVVDFN
ncbi:MAG: LemA protein [Rhodothermales bacterium]|jgi:LemA protein